MNANRNLAKKMTFNYTSKRAGARSERSNVVKKASKQACGSQPIPALLPSVVI